MKGDGWFNPDILEHGFLNVEWAQMGSLVAGARYRLQHNWWHMHTWLHPPQWPFWMPMWKQWSMLSLSKYESTTLAQEKVHHHLAFSYNSQAHQTLPDIQNLWSPDLHTCLKEQFYVLLKIVVIKLESQLCNREFSQGICRRMQSSDRCQHYSEISWPEAWWLSRSLHQSFQDSKRTQVGC